MAEFVNPFSRKEKKEFIPLSVFPASKLTRTSFQIGRAVPVYNIEVIKNNHWEIKISQLTRFLTMQKPVMNDFEVSFGAFYVPYVALDDVTGNSRALRASSSLATGSMTYSLHERDFFNPSTPDSSRVKVIKKGMKYYGDIKLIGSLWNHLQYPIYVDKVDIRYLSTGGIQLSPRSFYQIAFNSIDEIDETLGERIPNFSDLFVYGGNHKFSIGAISGAYVENYHSIGNVDMDIRLMPFDIWCYLNPYFNFTGLKSVFNSYGFAFVNYYKDSLSWKGDLSDTSLEKYLTEGSSFTTADISSIESDFTPFSILWISGESDKVIWSQYFGDYTREQVMDMYIQYLKNNYVVLSGIGQSADELVSMRSFLTYLRIYGDYFLNPLITDKEDFFKYTTALYIQSGAVDTPIQQRINYVFNTVLGTNNNIRFFFDYLMKGECLPVLWEKDFFTSSQVKEQIGNNVAIADGDTIPTLFYKRMWYKFKELIARFGSDYKINNDTLYGGDIPDSTLQRSQVIGFKRFSVNVGAIAQTSPTSQAGALADFAGYAYSNNQTDKFEWDAQENGMIMILCWIRPLYTAIVGAVPRYHIKSEYLDFLLPQFGGVGYQDIPEFLINPASGSPNTKFAIQERYFEYMCMINEVSGSFLDVARSYSVDRNVDGVIQLSESQSPEFLYITEKDEINRIFQDQSQDPILASIYFEGIITRQLPASIRTDF